MRRFRPEQIPGGNKSFTTALAPTTPVRHASDTAAKAYDLESAEDSTRQVMPEVAFRHSVYF